MPAAAGHQFDGIRAIEIDVDAAGVTVEATTEGDTATRVSLADRSGAPLEELLALEHDGDVLRAKVRVAREGRWRRNRTIDARLHVTTPASVALDITADAGSVKVDHRAAPVSVEADAGRIQLLRVGADVRVKTDAGAITVSDCIGTATIASDAGRITIERHQGELLDLRTNVGAITATNVEVGAVTASTDVGAIRLVHATPPVSVDASSSVGTVTIELPQDDYDIEQRVSGLGRARLEGLTSVSGASRTVRASSSGVGSITIRSTAAAPAPA